MSDESNRDLERGYYKAHLGIDHRKLAKMRDPALASWQSQYAPGSPQYILADQEWQNRRLARQIRAVYGAALIGLAGVVLGWYLRSLPELDHPSPTATTKQVQPDARSDQVRQGQGQTPSAAIAKPAIVEPAGAQERKSANQQQQRNEKGKP